MWVIAVSEGKEKNGGAEGIFLNNGWEFPQINDSCQTTGPGSSENTK